MSELGKKTPLSRKMFIDEDRGGQTTKDLNLGSDLDKIEVESGAFEGKAPRGRFQTEKLLQKIQLQQETAVDETRGQDAEGMMTNDDKSDKTSSNLSEDPVTQSQIEKMRDRLREELQGWQLGALQEMDLALDKKILPLKEQQEEYFKIQNEQMKAWRRARTDMQLYFADIKKRDALREEYVAIADSVDMLIDLHKVNMHQ